MKSKFLLLSSIFIGALVFFNVIHAESDKTEKPFVAELNVHQFIIFTQYLHELCLSIMPSKASDLNALYIDSGISKFDELIPKKYNGYIMQMNTPEKKENFFKVLPQKATDEIQIQCEEKLPPDLKMIKANLNELYNKEKQIFEDFIKRSEAHSE